MHRGRVKESFHVLVVSLIVSFIVSSDSSEQLKQTAREILDKVDDEDILNTEVSVIEIYDDDSLVSLR